MQIYEASPYLFLLLNNNNQPIFLRPVEVDYTLGIIKLYASKHTVKDDVLVTMSLREFEHKILTKEIKLNDRQV